jgi:hypothetical protein
MEATAFLKSLADVIDRAFGACRALPGFSAQVAQTKSAITEAIAAEESKQVDETGLGTAWRWAKKVLVAAFAGAGTVIVSIAVGATAVVWIPISAVSSVIVLLYMASGKTMWQLWQEKNARLILDADRNRGEMLALLRLVNCPCDLNRVDVDEAEKQRMAEWLANNQKALSALLMLGQSPNMTAQQAAAFVGL